MQLSVLLERIGNGYSLSIVGSSECDFIEHERLRTREYRILWGTVGILNLLTSMFGLPHFWCCEKGSNSQSSFYATRSLYPNLPNVIWLLSTSRIVFLSLTQVPKKAQNEWNSKCSKYYSTVTDFARLRGKSTFKPSATASQYAINWSGITLRSPCKQSTVLGISIFSACPSLNSSSFGLQITMGFPERAITE